MIPLGTAILAAAVASAGQDPAYLERLLRDGRRVELADVTPKVLLVVEPGYLSEEGLARLVVELREALEGLPRALGRPSRERGRVTVYVGGDADDAPLSNASSPGERSGETGVVLRFYKEGEAPLFHELAHVLAGECPSQSLSEGFADVLHERFRPGQARAFVPAGADPDALAREGLARFPRLKEAVGSPGYWTFSGPPVRHAFYYASWSFVRYLVEKVGVASFLAVYDAGASEDSYASAYGRSLEELRADWLAALGVATIVR